MQLTPRDKKILQVAAVVLPLLLLAWFFVLRPQGGEEVAIPEFPSGPTGGTEVPSVSPSATPRETLPPVELAGARDPFSIPPGLELTGGSISPTVSPSGSATSPPPTSPPPTSPPPTSPPPTSPPPTSPPPPPPPTNTIQIGGHDVKLTFVANSGRKLVVLVDGKLWTVEPGAPFDDNFMVVKIDGSCATFLFGDQSFELCEKTG